jgi:hypothetical protein
MHDEIFVQVLYISQIIARDNSCLAKRINPIIIEKLGFFLFQIDLFNISFNYCKYKGVTINNALYFCQTRCFFVHLFTFFHF